MVFRPDVIKKLTKQIETKTLLIYVWESKKSFLIFLFKLILMLKRLWKLGQLIYEHFFFNISTTIIIHNIYRYIYIYYMLEVKKKKNLIPSLKEFLVWNIEIVESIYVPEKREESGFSCFDLLIFLVETDKKCCYLYRALFTLGQGWSPCLFTQVCLELMLLFTVFVCAARPYLDSWDSHLLQTRALAQEMLHLWGSNAGFSGIGTVLNIRYKLFTFGNLAFVNNVTWVVSVKLSVN